VFTVLTTWQKGRGLVTRQRALDEGSLREFIEALHARRPPLHRVPGTAIFLNRGKATTPLAMRANVEHNQVLHDHVLIMSIETLPVPHVGDGRRLEIDDLGYKDDRIYHVTARFGYMDAPRIPPLLPLIREVGEEGRLDSGQVSYFLSTIEVVRGNTPGMSRWRKRLFVATTRLTRRRRVLPPPPRPHRHHGLPHRALTRGRPCLRAGRSKPRPIFPFCRANRRTNS